MKEVTYSQGSSNMLTEFNVSLPKKEVIYANEVGTKPLEFEATLTREEAMHLSVVENGRVFMLVGVTWREDGTARLTFVPSRGVIEIAETSEFSPSK